MTVCDLEKLITKMLTMGVVACIETIGNCTERLYAEEEKAILNLEGKEEFFL